MHRRRCHTYRRIPIGRSVASEEMAPLIQNAPESEKER